ncbi:MAG: hypothetical protein DRP68_02890 [Candidatus Omnitrophota bacterium]|nr:MAG: hypothetical protein DRP68_02890 [Candidatus Omnitrophota bacterium]
MSLVKPFSAFYYNPKKFKNLSPLITPPYDVIREKEKGILRKKSKYNFSHILLVDKNENYKLLGRRFNDWIKKEIFVQDIRPHFYLYEQKFNFQGKILRRVGFLCLLKLDKKETVFPHETTLRAPKKDRWYILKETKANLSPIFVVSYKKLKTLQNLYLFYTRKKPFIEFKNLEGVTHRLWKVEEKNLEVDLSREIEKSKLFIADGHHRFEVAYRYFKLNGTRFKEANYILAYLTDPSTSLIILPTHRVVELEEELEEVLKKLSSQFLIRCTNQRELLTYLKKGRLFSFGIYTNGLFYFLKLKNKKILDKIFKNKEERNYQKLDVYIFHKLVLKKFKVKEILYTHYLKELKKIAGSSKIGFILRSPSLETVFSFASRGYLLPQKSTYFYPKLPSGLVIRRIS